MRYKVGVVDLRARGHQLAKKYLESEDVSMVYVIPGAPGMALGNDPRIQTVPRIAIDDKESIVGFAKDVGIKLLDVAQDDAVAAGVVNHSRANGLDTVGPTSEAGILESSKADARLIAAEAHVTQPKYEIFTSVAAGMAHAAKMPFDKEFIKASFLARGKGVYEARSQKEAENAIHMVFNLPNGAGRTFLIEEAIRDPTGKASEESSYYAMCAGREFVVLGSAQDNKRLYDGNVGPMTGGIGTSSPHLAITASLDSIISSSVGRLLNVMADRGTPYYGVMYLGLALQKVNVQFLEVHTKKKREYTMEGIKPVLIEINARWGAPEAEVVIPGIQNDFLDLGMRVSAGNLQGVEIARDSKTRVGIVGVAKGYPGDISAAKGSEITGLFDVLRMPGVDVLGAGVYVNGKRHYIDEGRMFTLVAEGDNIAEAIGRGYDAMSRIKVEGGNMHMRGDIGLSDLERVLRN